MNYDEAAVFGLIVFFACIGYLFGYLVCLEREK
jgi:hypothetical protein